MAHEAHGFAMSYFHLPMGGHDLAPQVSETGPDSVILSISDSRSWHLRGYVVERSLAAHELAFAAAAATPVRAFGARLPLPPLLGMNLLTYKCVLPQQWPEWMDLARLRSYLCESIRCIVPSVFTMSWHPLEAERYVSPLYLGGCLEGCTNDYRSGRIPVKELKGGSRSMNTASDRASETDDG
ncbi:hypothetical protein PENNAL_c0214G10240 [Penicillium nalgiovense]|uniref:Uncharacterized protein n=1 Tax=Penicillium nalgiovense TaxID=60175 RepID=A0A1V6WQZ4_PENNA|nr:hypothetical protein PENNAL_c0214G10240 [Penicillium nalgiovense]